MYNLAASGHNGSVGLASVNKLMIANTIYDIVYSLFQFSYFKRSKQIVPLPAMFG
jgi:hypothetical protein